MLIIIVIIITIIIIIIIRCMSVGVVIRLSAVKTSNFNLPVAQHSAMFPFHNAHPLALPLA